MPRSETTSPASKSSPRGVVMRRVRALIESGEFSGGEPLPSERTLALELNVARRTVRAALAELEAQGVIRGEKLRTRRVFTGRSPHHARDIFSSTVIIVSRHATPPAAFRLTGHRGWDVYIQAEAAVALQEAGMHVMTINPDRLAQGNVSSMLAIRPWGVIVTWDAGETDAGRHIIAQCAAQRIPLACYGDGPALAECDRVASDHAEGAAQLTRWLIAQNCKRIVQVWSTRQQPPWLVQREQGYQRAMIEAGLTCISPLRMADLPNLVHEDGSLCRDEFQDLVRMQVGFLAPLFKSPDRPDALMCITDRHAIQVAAACRLLGVDPERDVKIVGYDNTWATDDEHRWDTFVPAATVDKCNTALARKLVDLVLKRGGNQLPREPQYVVSPPQLVFPVETTAGKKSAMP